MSTAARVGESLASDIETIDEDFFRSTGDPAEDGHPLDVQPFDPILERKMSLAVRARRSRLTRLVKGAVGCALLLLLVAIVTGLAPDLRRRSATVATHAVAPSR
jgi:hypothetical protein